MSHNPVIEMKPIPDRWLKSTSLWECWWCHEKKPLTHFVRPMRNGYWTIGHGCVSCLDQRRRDGKLKGGKQSSQNVTPRKRYLVLKRDAYRCQICGASAPDGAKLHIDHKVPVSKGGTSDMSNLWALCEACNLGKSNLDL